MAAAAMERATHLLGETIDRHPGALIGASATAIGGTLSVIDGATASTAAATAVAGLTVAVCTLLAKTLLSDIKGLRARIATLEARETQRLEVMDAERARMAARITDLEARLAQQDGDGR